MPSVPFTAEKRIVVKTAKPITPGAGTTVNNAAVKKAPPSPI